MPINLSLHLSLWINLLFCGCLAATKGTTTLPSSLRIFTDFFVNYFTYIVNRYAVLRLQFEQYLFDGMMGGELSRILVPRPAGVLSDYEN